jgi:hypothetical protein
MAYIAPTLAPVLQSNAKVTDPATEVTTKLLLPQQPSKLVNPTDPYAPVRAQVSKPLRVVENVFGPSLRADPKNQNQDVSDALKPQSFGRDKLNMGSLPYSTAPRLRRTPLQQLVPINTRVPPGEWKEAIARAGPFYYRYWPIWDTMPFLPSRGDVSLDPRYVVSQSRRVTTSSKSKGI